MTTMDTRLKEVFADAFELSPDEITEDMSIKSCSSWDSLRSITLSHSLEQVFEVEFTDRELMQIDSYASVKEILIGKGVSL